ncbi:VOC family protein [Salinibacterium soli]|uniref:VOC family protein n=1 Tax=Antiquaquibacter soli TaxID=3064523 RepID=A0ABT9BLK5_9MICO|nr:VOC family protein [Protaetiibacter sp. WY-16]MDO7881899.1 VOC family protein [Protaetiibacter sp. WY-16]
MAELWVHTVTIEARDPARLSRFWAELLDYVVMPNHTDSVEIGDPTGSGPRLLFAPGDTAGTGRDRFHLDLRPDDRDDSVRRALDLGATELPTPTGTSWVRLADPEGNRFCILQSQGDFDAYVSEHGEGTPSG